MADSKKAPRAYLIGGDGFHKLFWPSLVMGYCVTHNSLATWAPIATIHALRHQAYDYLLDCLMRGSHKMMWWSVFGLLSSSCCAVQLILNVFNFGCAGFNTYLGPLRPVFLAMTITLNARMWELAIPNLGLPSTPEYFLPSIIASTVVAVGLSILPEIVDFRVSRRRYLSPQKEVANSGWTCVNVILSLEGLGCVACTSAVQGAIECSHSNKVVANKVDLEEKKATITLSCDEDEAKETVVPDIIARIEDAGFGASLESIGKTNGESDNSSELPGSKRIGTQAPTSLVKRQKNQTQ